MQRRVNINDWPLVIKLLVSMALLITLALVIVALVSNYLTERSLNETIDIEFRQLASAEGQRVGSVLENQYRLLAVTIADGDSVQAAARAANASYTGTSQETLDSILSLDAQWVAAPQTGSVLINQLINNEAADKIRSYLEEVVSQKEILATDRYGALITASNRTSDYYQADEEWWQVAWNNGEGAVYFGTPVLDESSGAVSIDIAMPIHDPNTNKPIGVIKGTYLLTDLVAEVNSFAMGDTGHADLINATGAYIASRHAEGLGQSVRPDQLLGGRVFNGSTGVTHNVTGENGNGYVLGYAPVRAFVVDSPVNQLGWVVQVLQERSEVYAPLTQQRTALSGLTLVAILIAAGAAFVIARALTRQAIELEHLFSNVRIGEFSSRARVLSKDELGRVADGVNGVLDMLTDMLSESERHLAERIKELTALHETARAFQDETRPADTILQTVVALLPPAFQYPDNAAARLTFDALTLESPGFSETPWMLSQAFVTSDGTRGRIEVAYLDEHPEAVEGPFLAEERNLLNSMAEMLEAHFERQRAENALHQQLAIIENSQDFIALTDMDGVQLYINPAGVRMAGYDNVNELLGRRILDFYLPEDLKQVEEVGIPAAFEKGLWTGENRLHHRDGTLIPVEQTIFIIRDAQGQPRNIATIMADITERKDLEAQQQQTFEQMSRQTAILDNMKDFAGFANMQNQAVYINDAGLDMLGYTRQDIPNLSILGVYASEERRWVQEVMLPLALKEGGWSGEVTIVRKDGSTFPAQQVVTLIWDKVGEPQAIGTIIRDISDQKRIMFDVEDAANQVTDASTAMTELVQIMAGQAANSASMAERAAHSASEGDRAVKDTIGAMFRIRENTQETARRIKRLGEVSQEISEVVRLSEDVADRTTVLALNASIQAAAAGEAGRGFAVVAEEVQRLSERATGATREIEALVKNIQAETNEAVVSVEEATREVVGGSQLAQRAGEHMADLNSLVGSLVTLVQSVSQTATEQTTDSMTTLGDLLDGLQTSVAAFGLSGDDDSGHVIKRGNGAAKGNGSAARAADVPKERRSPQTV